MKSRLSYLYELLRYANIYHSYNFRVTLECSFLAEGAFALYINGLAEDCLYVPTVYWFISNMVRRWWHSPGYYTLPSASFYCWLQVLTLLKKSFSEHTIIYSFNPPYARLSPFVTCSISAFLYITNMNYEPRIDVYFISMNDPYARWYSAFTGQVRRNILGVLLK
jgi:hypothetical protein